MAQRRSFLALVAVALLGFTVLVFQSNAGAQTGGAPSGCGDAAAPYSPGATLTATPATVVAGGAVTVAGSGFPGGCEGSIFFDGGPDASPWFDYTGLEARQIVAPGRGNSFSKPLASRSAARVVVGTIAVVTDATGAFSTTVTTPNFALGTYTARATVGAVTATTTFTVVAATVTTTPSSLPVTGSSNTTMLVQGGLVLVAIGGLLVLVTRKRRTATTSA